MANFLDFSKSQLENLINQIYSGSVNARNLPVDLYRSILGRLTHAVHRGVGGTGDDFDDGSPDQLLLKYYEHNIAIFSGAKTHQQIKHCNFTTSAAPKWAASSIASP